MSEVQRQIAEHERLAKEETDRIVREAAQRQAEETARKARDDWR